MQAVTTIVELLIPPTGLLILALLLLPWRRGRGLVAALLVLVLACTTPLVSRALLRTLAVASVPAGPPPQAIVVLSADVERTGVPGQPMMGALTLERLRAGVALARRTGLPLLVTGGVVTEAPPVGRLMAASLRDDFALPARWVEDASATTWENASMSSPMLKADGVGRVYLVTHEWHMRRGLLAFARAGMEAVPAPVREEPGPGWVWQEVVPRPSGWARTYYAMHEWIGLLAYRWRR